MLEEEHIFTIKTKDPQNVADIKSVATGVIISGLNVLKDKIRVGDLAFVVLGGDKPAWKTGLVGIAQISRIPFDEGYDGKKNFRVGIDIKAYFNPIARGDLVTYPDTFDTIGIGPITKWEPNQAITSVPKKNAIALLHAICDLRPEVLAAVRSLLGAEFSEVEKDIYRYVIAKSKLGGAPVVESTAKNFQDEFITWWCGTKKRAEKTARNYIGYLASLNKPIGEKTNSTWPGVYVYLFGRKSSKEVIQIGTLDQFDEIFGPFCRIFDDSGCPEDADPDAYANCVQWIKDVSQWACLSSAFNAYREFLEWRETQNKTKDEPPPSANVDRLDIALRLFDKEREESDRHSKYADLAREWFRDYTPQKLKDDFATFQKDLIWSGMVRAQVTKDYAHVDKLAELLDELKRDPRPVSYYLDETFKTKLNACPGIGIGTVIDMLMKMHPDEYCAYTDMMHGSLKTLGLLSMDASTKLTPENYRVAMGLYEKIRQRMKQLGVHLTRGDNKDDPDFLTVNAFLWFVKENENLIKEEVMSKKLKRVNSKEKIKKGSRKLEDAFKSDEMLKRLAAALRTKPFAILAGHSGTGKSQLVRRLAYMTCNNELLVKEGEGKTAPGNYCMVQVKPNWHDSTDLLGYYSEMGGRHFVNTSFVQFICKAYAYPDTPFFVCLDEMNLAPVEQYFAEYLSAVESMEKKDDVWVTDPLVEVDKTGEKDADGKDKVNLDILEQVMNGATSTEAAEWIQKHGLTIPKNLFVVGTVNMDETTCQFSRKVLDRAMTLLMNKVKFASMTTSKKPSEEGLLDEDGLKFFLEGVEKGNVGQNESELLDGVNEPLANTAFVVAYRFANEYALYEAALAELEKFDLASADEAKKKEFASRALDHVVLMKLLPRIHGEAKTVKGIFEGRKVDGKDVPGLKSKLPSGGLSVAMMDKILARGDEYLTFWP